MIPAAGHSLSINISFHFVQILGGANLLCMGKRGVEYQASDLLVLFNCIKVKKKTILRNAMTPSLESNDKNAGVF